MASADATHLDGETLSLLALGALPVAEGRAAEAHLATCDACRRGLALRRGELAALAESVDPVEPPASVRRSLLARLAAGAPPGTTAVEAPTPIRSRGEERRRRGLLLPLAASFLVGALVGAFAVRQAFVGEVRELAAEADALAGERSSSRRELDRVRGELAAARAALALVPAPEAVPLSGLAGAPGARGRVFVDRTRGRALFVASDLPQLPAGRTYQLWRIVDGRPISAGLLGSAEGTVIVEEVAAVAGEVWAVTIEPAGGVASPSGEMVLSS